NSQNKIRASRWVAPRTRYVESNDSGSGQFAIFTFQFSVFDFPSQVMSFGIGEQVTARFLAPELLARIGSLDLIARTVVEGFISGLHHSPYLGFSTDFAEHRQYMPGDDIRHLDWKLLGRTDRLYIKKYQGDTNSQIHLLIDTSGSMGYGSGEITKLQYTQYLASALASLGIGQHDSVGVIAFDEGVVEHVPPRSKLGQLRTILGLIERLEPGRLTALSEQLHRTAELITRRGIVVLIS